MIFSDETTIRLNTVKGLVRRKEDRTPTVKHSTKMNVWSCFSSQGFACIVCFKQNLNPELKRNIYERRLLLTIWQHLSLDATIWELQEDNNDSKHTSKTALSWKTNYDIQKVD